MEDWIENWIIADFLKTVVVFLTTGFPAALRALPENLFYVVGVPAAALVYLMPPVMVLLSPHTRGTRKLLWALSALLTSWFGWLAFSIVCWLFPGKKYGQYRKWGRPRSGRFQGRGAARLDPANAADQLELVERGDLQANAADQLELVERGDLQAKAPVNQEAFNRILRIADPHVRALGPPWRISPEMSMGSFLGTPHDSNNAYNDGAFRSINSKRVDFMITGPRGVPALAIEYDGTGHYGGRTAYESRKATDLRDKVKRRALEKAGVPVLVADRKTPPEEIIRAIDAVVAMHRGRTLAKEAEKTGKDPAQIEAEREAARKREYAQKMEAKEIAAEAEKTGRDPAEIAADRRDEWIARKEAEKEKDAGPAAANTGDALQAEVKQGQAQIKQ